MSSSCLSNVVCRNVGLCFSDALMKALAGGSGGFAYLSRVLGVLLQTLLQDEIAEVSFSSLFGPPRWPSGKASASRAEDPEFESRLRRDFFGVESYK